MARVLLAWEFGGDLGHLRHLAALAGALRAQGHEAARDATSAEPELIHRDNPVVL